MAESIDNIYKTEEQKDLEIRKLRAEVARLEAQIKPTTGEAAELDLRKTRADVLKAESELAPKKEPKITRPLDKPRSIGPEGQETLTEEVSQEQAVFDQGRIKALNEWADQTTKNALEAARIDVAKGTLDASTAAARYKEKRDAIDDLYRAEVEETKKEGHRIQREGHGVSMRGQDLNYEQSLVGDVARLQAIENQKAPRAVWDSYYRGIGQHATADARMAEPVFDPQAFITKAAQTARAALPPQIQPQYAAPALPQKPQAPLQLPPGPFGR